MNQVDKRALDMEVMAANAGEAEALLKEMANRNRLMILCTLVAGELRVTELNAAVPLSQSALSQHLQRLRLAGLVTTRREGQSIYYRLAGGKVDVLLQTLHSLFCEEQEAGGE